MIKIFIAISIIIWIISMAVIVMSACQAGKESDERIDRMFKEWENEAN